MFQTGWFWVPHIWDVVISHFLLWGPPFMTRDGPKMVRFGSKMAKHSRLVTALKWFKRVQKRPKMANLSVLDDFGHIWTILDHFRQKWFFSPNRQSRDWRRCFRAKDQLLFEMVQKGPDGPKWSKKLRLTILVLRDHFGGVTSLPLCLYQQPESCILQVSTHSDIQTDH